MDADIKAKFENVSTATISMQLLKRGIRHAVMSGVKPLNVPAKSIVGEAYTLRYIPMREDLSAPDVLGRPDFEPRRAIEEAPPGAVLVIDGRGRADTAVIGDILTERLKVRGVAGIVSDGGIRDASECLESDLPIFAAGPAAPATITFHSAGDLQCPIGCGGVAVIPGDIIVGDGDGIVVVPQALAFEIADDSIEQERYEKFAKMQIKKGKSIRGVYPPNEDIKAAYATWLDAGEPEA